MSKRDKFKNSDSFVSNNNGATSTNVLEFLLGNDDALPHGEESSLVTRKAKMMESGDIQFGEFVLSLKGLSFTGEAISFSEWKDMGVYLNRHKDAIQWMIGDWANLAEKYIEQWVPDEIIEIDVPDGKYRWLARETGYSYGYLRNIASVASIYPMSSRNDTLTFKHHLTLATDVFTLEDREKLLNLAAENEWSVTRLREEAGLSVPPSKQSALVSNITKIRKNWRRSWGKMNVANKQSIVDELRSMLTEMESELE